MSNLEEKTLLINTKEEYDSIILELKELKEQYNQNKKELMQLKEEYKNMLHDLFEDIS